MSSARSSGLALLWMRWKDPETGHFFEFWEPPYRTGVHYPWCTLPFNIASSNCCLLMHFQRVWAVLTAWKLAWSSIQFTSNYYPVFRTIWQVVPQGHCFCFTVLTLLLKQFWNVKLWKHYKGTQELCIPVIIRNQNNNIRYRRSKWIRRSHPPQGSDSVPQRTETGEGSCHPTLL